ARAADSLIAFGSSLAADAPPVRRLRTTSGKEEIELMNLALIGALLAVIGNLWIVVLAFRTGLLWGLGCLLVPIVGLVYCVLNFRETWKPFVIAVIGLLLFFANFGQPGA